MECPSAALVGTAPSPKTRRPWKRWTALAIILALGCGVWMASGESETVRNGRRLRIGMTDAEVHAIMGEPLKVSQVALATIGGPRIQRYQMYGTRDEQLIRNIRLALLWLRVKTGIGEPGYGAPFPVFVQFDEGKVSGIITQ